MIYSRFTVTNSKHIAAKHWHEQLSSTFHLTGMGMIVQQDSIIPALFLQNAKLMVRILLSFRNDPVQLVQIRSIYRQMVTMGINSTEAVQMLQNRRTNIVSVRDMFCVFLHRLFSFLYIFEIICLATYTPLAEA